MAKKNEESNGEETQSGSTSTPVEPQKIRLIQFCDSQGVNDVDRNAVFMKYGKLTEKTEKEWIELLSSKITLKK
jgi:hypothetical protein